MPVQSKLFGSLPPLKFTYPINEIDDDQSTITNTSVRNDHVDANTTNVTSFLEGSGLSCSKCHLCFDKLSYLAIHNKLIHTHSIQFFCPIEECNTPCDSIGQLTSHCNRHQSIHHLQCPQCQKGFKDPRVFQMHISIHLIELEEEVISLKVPEFIETDTGNDYESLLAQLDSLFTKHVYDLKSWNHQGKFNCPSCDMFFTSKLRLSLHKCIEN